MAPPPPPTGHCKRQDLLERNGMDYDPNYRRGS
jgi:hypothetical protein